MKTVQKLKPLFVALIVAYGSAAYGQVETPVDSVTGSEAKLDLGDTPAPGKKQPTELATVVSTSNIAQASMAARTPQKVSAKPGSKPVQKPKMLSALDDYGGADFLSTKSEATVQRVQFDRLPIRVALPISVERLVTFPNPVALHVPSGMEGSLSTQVLERTAYLRALENLEGTRVIAEDLVTGQMIPLDLYADGKVTGGSKELQIFFKNTGIERTSSSPDKDDQEDAAVDMVTLTRFASQSMFAPKRLLPSLPGVYNVPIEPKPISGLIRGQRVGASPLGQWRSGGLFVSAVRITNLEPRPLDLNVDELRGSWLAATPQHKHLLAAGSDWDWTILYLVCGGSFETCKQ